MARTEGNSDTVQDDMFPVSRATFQTIMDRLQHLEREVSSLTSFKLRVEMLEAENDALRRGGELRGQNREGARPRTLSVQAPSPAADTRSRSSSLSYVSEIATTPLAPFPAPSEPAGSGRVDGTYSNREVRAAFFRKPSVDNIHRGNLLRNRG